MRLFEKQSALSKAGIFLMIAFFLGSMVYSMLPGSMIELSVISEPNPDQNVAAVLGSGPYETVGRGQIGNFSDLVRLFIGIIELLVYFLFAIMFVVIMWGLAQGWVLNPDNESARNKGKQTAIAGIIGCVVFIGLWGIVALLKSSFF